MLERKREKERSTAYFNMRVNGQHLPLVRKKSVSKVDLEEKEPEESRTDYTQENAPPIY